MNLSKMFVYVSAVLMLTATLAFGQAPQRPTDDTGHVGLEKQWWQLDQGDRLSAGVGLVLSPKPYKDVDTDTILIPMIMYEGKRLSIRGKTAEYVLFSEDWWQLSGVLDMRFDGYEDDDSSALNGMDDREWTLESGLAFKVSDDTWGSIRLGWLMDILSEHEGHELSLRYNYPIRMDKLVLTPNVGFAFHSDDLVDYYYGVENDEVRAGRPAYQADSTVNWFTGLGIGYELYENWTLYSNMRFEFYGDEIRESPIVDEDYGFGAIFGIMYSF